MNTNQAKAPQSGADSALAERAAIRLYEKGLRATSVVASLKKGGHSLAAVAAAAHRLPTLDAMLFSEAWGGDLLEQRKARCAFMDTESRSVTRAGACDEIPADCKHCDDKTCDLCMDDEIEIRESALRFESSSDAGVKS